MNKVFRWSNTLCRAAACQKLSVVDHVPALIFHTALQTKLLHSEDKFSVVWNLSPCLSQCTDIQLGGSSG